MHVLIHVNLCPLQAQARISRVKRHLWHPDHHTILFAYIYIKWKTFFFFNPVGTRTDCQIWFLNVLLSCSWFMFAFFSTEQHRAVFMAMMGFESYRLCFVSKSYPLKNTHQFLNTQLNDVGQGQHSQNTSSTFCMLSFIKNLIMMLII